MERRHINLIDRIEYRIEWYTDSYPEVERSQELSFPAEVGQSSNDRKFFKGNRLQIEISKHHAMVQVELYSGSIVNFRVKRKKNICVLFKGRMVSVFLYCFNFVR